MCCGSWREKCNEKKYEVRLISVLIFLGILQERIRTHRGNVAEGEKRPKIKFVFVNIGINFIRGFYWSTRIILSCDIASRWLHDNAVNISYG